jgi:ADP-ribose pyrophosphatase YjhB (NUDIX family)
VAEETGLFVTPLQVVKAFDHIDRDHEGKVQFHYVLVDFVCRIGAENGKRVASESETSFTAMVLRHGSDVSDARWVAVEELRTSKEFPLTERALEVIAAAWSAFRKNGLSV